MYRNPNISRPYGEGVIVLNRRRKKGFSRLRVELLFSALLSLVVAYGCHILVREGGNYYLDSLIASDEYMYGKNEKMSRQFQGFVDREQLLLEDTADILYWCREYKTSVTLYNETTQGLYSYYSFAASRRYPPWTRWLLR